jgi:hypothetical protein
VPQVPEQEAEPSAERFRGVGQRDGGFVHAERGRGLRVMRRSARSGSVLSGRYGLKFRLFAIPSRDSRGKAHPASGFYAALKRRSSTSSLAQTFGTFDM